MEELTAGLAALPDDLHRRVGAVSVDGVVHLVGHARSAAAAQAAHDVATGMAGVKDVINEVQIDAGAPMDAASISNRVIQSLVQSGLLTSSTLEVHAVGGEVVLKGIVESPEERERAAEIAS